MEDQTGIQISRSGPHDQALQGCQSHGRVDGATVINSRDGRSIAQMTADYFDLDKSLIEKTDGSQFKQTAKRPPKTGFIIDKAKEVVGYNPHSFKEGIALLADQIK